MEGLFSWNTKKERENVRPAKSIKPIKTQVQDHEHFKVNDLTFKKVIFDPKLLNSSLSTELKKTDLIPDVYEGGFKLWECCVDMVQFLRDENVNLKNVSLLDLGCGVSISGIYALQQGANVDFQDYNEEVIQHITIPNALLNTSDSEIDRCNFYAGDWSLLQDYITTKYDVILSTDTLYSLDNHGILAKFIANRLSSTGVCYIGAKSYYFGIGGGVTSFLSTIEEEGKLNFEIVKKIMDNVSNVREIIKLTLKV